MLCSPNKQGVGKWLLFGSLGIGHQIPLTKWLLMGRTRRGAVKRCLSTAAEPDWCGPQWNLVLQDAARNHTSYTELAVVHFASVPYTSAASQMYAQYANCSPEPALLNQQAGKQDCTGAKPSQRPQQYGRLGRPSPHCKADCAQSLSMCNAAGSLPHS